MIRYPQEILVRYGGAAGIIALIPALRQVTDPLFGGGPPLLLFMGAVMIAARYAGLGPGLFATALSAVFIIFLYMPRFESLRAHSLNDVFGILALLVVGAAISSLMARLRAARARADASVAQARAQEAADCGTEERFRLFVESVRDYAILMLDPAGHVTSWNAGAQRIKGYRSDEILGEHFSRFYSAADVQAGKPEHELHMARDEGRHEDEGWRIRKDGSRFWANVVFTAVRDETGELRGYSKVTRDITERKLAEERTRHAQGDLEERVRERTAKLALANETLLLGLTRAEHAEAVLRERTTELEAAHERLAATARFVGTLNQSRMLDAYRGALGCLIQTTGIPLAVIYDCGNGHPPVPHCAVGAGDQLLDSAPFTGAGLPATVVHTGEVQILVGPFPAAELRLYFGLGEVGLHSIMGWPIEFQDRCLGALLTAHTAPLTEETRAFIIASIAQLAIRMDGFQVEKQRLALVDDLRAQSLELEAAKLGAQRADRIKSEFLGNISHELRTPMNSIMGFTRRLLKKLGATLPERELDALQTVDRNARHLVGLINDILALSKIEAGEMLPDCTCFDLVALVREAAEQAAPVATSQPAVEIRLEMPDVPLMFVGDRVMLKSLVVNLLANCTKDSAAGTVTISVSVGDDPGLGQVARVAVRDTGMGVMPDELDRLSQQFDQLDGSLTRKVVNTGLGLAITGLYARMHGGRIDVASEFGHGAEFTVILPLRAGALVAGPSLDRASESATKTLSLPSFKVPPRLPSRTGGVRILCVDDQPDALKFLQLTFEEAGYEVLRATNHDAAIEGAKAGRPDLICLDLGMPGKDGYEVLKSLRADPELAGVPVIVVTVTTDRARLFACGVNRFLAKPVDADELLAMVHDLLSRPGGSALLIEDNPDSSRLVTAMLAEAGLVVRTAANGLEGLARLAEWAPSVIVLDLMMPVMDGFTFLEHLKRNPAWDGIPVVVLTAKNLTPAEVAHLGRVSAAILTKGRGDTKRVVEAILKTVRPRTEILEEVAP